RFRFQTCRTSEPVRETRPRPQDLCGSDGYSPLSLAEPASIFFRWSPPKMLSRQCLCTDDALERQRKTRMNMRCKLGRSGSSPPGTPLEAAWGDLPRCPEGTLCPEARLRTSWKCGPSAGRWRVTAGGEIPTIRGVRRARFLRRIRFHRQFV